MISAALAVILAITHVKAAQPPVVRDPGVIYLADFDLKPVKLRVLEAAPTSFDQTGNRYAGTLRVGQDVELQAVGDTLYRVRGKAQQGQILAWVSPDFLAPLPDGFIASLRASNERLISVENLIAKREVAIGMTLQEVERSIGRPNKRSTRTNADRTEHTWEYVRYANIPQQTTVVGADGVATTGTVWVKTPIGTLTVNFSDEIVASIVESEGSITQGVQTTIVAPPILLY